MLSRAWLLSVATFLSLSLSLATSLQCYSTICNEPDEHGFCIETCHRPDEACYGSFFITPNHTVTPGVFRCHVFAGEECSTTLCQISDSLSLFSVCCCRQNLCNTIAGLFGDITPAPPVRPVTGPHGDILCDDARCSHSCVISDGIPRCLCPAGYALDTDLSTCIDINECADPHSHQCSHICINTEGSYRCDCPTNQSLRLASNGTHCEQISGLFCAQHNQECNSTSGCDATSFCDHALSVSHDHAHESCIAVVYLINGEFVIIFQSCYTSFDAQDCAETECNLKLFRTSGSRAVYSCCCRSNLCNAHLIYPAIQNGTNPLIPDTLPVTTDGTIDREGTVTSTTGSDSPTKRLSRWMLLILAATVVAVFMLTVIITCVIIQERKACFSKTEDEFLPPIQLLPRATQCPLIGRGRFSNIYKQMVARDIRAIKVFQRKYKQSYDHELSIYQLPHFEHPNILLFIGSNEHPEELQLILEYHQVGSLYDLLNKQTITMKQFCEIASSAARGLAHLHTDVIKDGVLIKACIAHRDLKSKNILIKSDLHTACISDFGLAIKWPIETITEAQGQVGTLLYMAPEVLEGAINFDREAYFRIDIYAFALILWELTTRTKTLNCPVAEYRPPFDGLVPSNPSIEDMKRVVVHWQRRPEIPKAFSEMDTIVNTIQETWDGDVDARLSSQCVYERLATFAHEFESTKGLSFSPSELDTTEMSA